MTVKLRVNPIACVGHGMCAELLPEMVELDRWGYPIVASPQVPGALVNHARRAAKACPTLALLIEETAGGTAKRVTRHRRHRRRPGYGRWR